MNNEFGVNICNTKFERPYRKLCTHRPISTVRDHSEWTYEYFDQIDFVLINNRFKNSCTNCETDVDARIDSDHYPVWATFTIRLKVPIIPKKIAATDRKQNTENIRQFRSTFLQHMDEELETQQPINEHSLDTAFRKAELHLNNRKAAIKKTMDHRPDIQSYY